MPQVFATRDPLKKAASATLSNWNLTHVWAAWSDCCSTIWVSSWKWFWEYTIDNAGTNPWLVMVWIQDGLVYTSYLATYWYAYWKGWANWEKYNHSSTPTTYWATYTHWDVIWVAIDLDNHTITCYKNWVSQWTMFTWITDTTYYAAVSCNAAQSTVNFWASAFAYSVPSWYNSGLYTGEPPSGTSKFMPLLGVW